jgi:hypothetical protein
VVLGDVMSEIVSSTALLSAIASAMIVSQVFGILRDIRVFEHGRFNCDNGEQ